MLAFLRFLKTKMMGKKLMMALLLIGNILLIAICSSCPMYIDAARDKALSKTLNELQNTTGSYPGAVTFEVTSRTYKEAADRESLFAYGDTLAVDIPASLDHATLASVKTYTIPLFQVKKTDASRSLGINLIAKSDLSSHISVQEGTDFVSESGVIPVLLSDRSLMDLDLRIGDTFTADQLVDDAGKSLTLKIVGSFVLNDSSDPYWDISPSALSNYFFISQEAFEQYFVSNVRYSITAEWRFVLDSEGLTLSDLTSVTEQAKAVCANDDRFSAELGFSSIMEDSVSESEKVTLTLWVLQVLTLLLLVVFLFMVASQLMQMEQNEISVYKSRGASRKQIFLLYLLQSSILAIISLIIGIPLAVFFCQTIGSANEFLQFVSRKALPITIDSTVLLFALGATVLSMTVTLIPVVRQSRIDIVQAKRSRQKKNKKPFWQRIFIDFVLIIAALATWYINIGQTDEIAADLAAGKMINPFLYVASALFLIGCALLVLRIFPYLMKGIFAIGKKLWSPALYASFLQMMRSAGNRSFLMAFLMLTVASGVYYSVAACSINTNAEQGLYYESGADLVLQEDWKFNSGATLSIEGSSQNAVVGYVEPDYSRYLELFDETPELASMTRVYAASGLTAKVDISKAVENVQLLGINTKEFGETANMNANLLPTHWYHYLNAMSQNIKGVLLSTNFHDDYGVELGDSITYTTSTGATLQGIVAGFVDYFPTYRPNISVEDEVVSQYLIVANFQNIYDIASQGRAIPYQIWMKLNGRSQFIYDFANEQGIRFKVFDNYADAQITLKNKPLFQGTNGVLTIGFIVTLLLCAVGFLMYWIFSIKERQLQFGIFRAMGMTSGEVMVMLGCEQIFVSGLSVLMGYFIGIGAAKLFVPLIQVAYSSADRVLPLAVIASNADLAKLFIIVGIVMLVCISVIAYMVKRLKISQALKLGED